ncbi:MAG: hypothetical protein EWV83_07695 [Microcystis sp. M_OC_Ca_00000000_S217Cul]|nr:MAG: hypothetical protein EWV83_07695 [Microcystis sp. M_OC_Ca_00000000_S217Cul]TRT89034.1 MAG: hypothetical protein EWV66_11090 [Microcystis sp. M_OC_Ca_00000000_C217Col]
MSIVCDLERTNQLSLLPDQDLVDLCPPIEPYQVTKNPKLCRFRQGEIKVFSQFNKREINILAI